MLDSACPIPDPGGFFSPAADAVSERIRDNDIRKTPVAIAHGRAHAPGDIAAALDSVIE
jgi:hypothetical protein